MMAEIQGEEIYLEHSGQEIDDAVDEVASLSTAVSGKADAADLAAEVTAREAADTAMQTALDSKTPLTVGASIIDPDPDNGVYADLFTLGVGKYQRQNNITRVQNIPAGLTTAFYCIVENTISANRRRVLLYPATASLAGTFYCCVETSTGYGSWYKFEGAVVVS